MATVPSGYAYYDTSASTVIEQGKTMPAPGAGDRYYGVNYTTHTTDNSKPDLQYYNSEVVKYYYRDSDTSSHPEWREYTIPAGWRLLNKAYTMSSLSVPQTINGANVVSIYINGSGSNITSINIPSTIVRVEIVDAPKVTTISGTLGANLKEFQCINATGLVSVPSLANATSMVYGGYMFYKCTALQIAPQLPPNVTSLYSAFYQCTSLTTPANIPSKVIDMANMYSGCRALTTVPENNSTVALYMQAMFYNCENIIDASNFNSSITMQNGSNMFCNCSKLVSPPTIRGTNASIAHAFDHCISLELPPAFEGSFNNVGNCFDYCESLVEPAIFPSNTLAMVGVYRYCSSLLHTGVIPSKATTIAGMFRECTALTTVNLMIPNTVSNTDFLFYGCVNLTGIIWKQESQSWPTGTDMFYNTQQNIIIYSAPDMSSGISGWVNSANNHNVYIGLDPSHIENSIVRSDLDGTLDDNSQYIKLVIKFKYPVIDNCKIYVPKIYIKNQQQQPIQDWILTYTNSTGETINKTIINSTDITVAQIEANDLIEDGVFETFFETTAEEGSAYLIVIPTSCNKVPRSYDNNGDYVYETYYWSNTVGQAIFTGDTYIFDALPDGSAFKVGGPIMENTGETGFIVGNQISLVEAQYPSTFNGPVTFNSNIYIAIDENASSEYLDGRIYDRINTLNWRDVLG